MNKQQPLTSNQLTNKGPTNTNAPQDNQIQEPASWGCCDVCFPPKTQRIQAWWCCCEVGEGTAPPDTQISACYVQTQCKKCRRNTPNRAIKHRRKMCNDCRRFLQPRDDQITIVFMLRVIFLLPLFIACMAVVYILMTVACGPQLMCYDMTIQCQDCGKPKEKVRTDSYQNYLDGKQNDDGN